MSHPALRATRSPGHGPPAAACGTDTGARSPPDGFLTDTYVPGTGAAGAIGRTHDWALSRRLVELSPRPLILAGGLTPANVREAVAVVQPAGVDAHTGVEDASGRKDRAKLLAFVAEASSP